MSVRLIIFIVVLSFVSYARLEIQFKLSPEAQCVLDKASDIPDDIYFRNLFVTHQDGKTPFTKFLRDYLIVSEYLYRLFINKVIDMDFDDRMPDTIKTAILNNDTDQLLSDRLKSLDDVFFYYVIRHHSIMQRCFTQCYSQEYIEKTHTYTSWLVLQTCIITESMLYKDLRAIGITDLSVHPIGDQGFAMVKDYRVFKYNMVLDILKIVTDYVDEHSLDPETIQNQELTNIQQSLKKTINKILIQERFESFIGDDDDTSVF